MFSRSTELKAVKFDYAWTIKHFSSWAMEAVESLKSPTFRADPNDEQQPNWFLQLYPSGDREESKGYFSVQLWLTRCNETANTADAEIEFFILNARSEKIKVKSDLNQFKDGKQCCWGVIFREDFVHNVQNAFLPDDQFTLVCDISVPADMINMTEPCAIPESRLVDDMDALLARSLFADCVICSGDEEFQAHKGVLSCRSPVFAAMFGHGLEESRTNKVNIEDISAPELGQLLEFVYTDRAPPLLAEQGMAQALLAAADKYQLDRLKALCEQQLCLAMNSENVCEVLTLADRHNAEQLKKRAIDFICLHAKEVLQSEGWRRLDSPELLKQLCGGANFAFRKIDYCFTLQNI